MKKIIIKKEEVCIILGGIAVYSGTLLGEFIAKKVVERKIKKFLDKKTKEFNGLDKNDKEFEAKARNIVKDIQSFMIQVGSFRSVRTMMNDKIEEINSQI